MAINQQGSEIALDNATQTISPLSVKQRLQQFWKANRAQIKLWFWFRLFLTLVPILAFVFLGNQTKAFSSNEPIGGTWTNYILGSWTRWDGLDYIDIAQYGYTPSSLIAFYPLYPLLMRGLAFVIAFGQLNSVSLALAGVIISSFSTLVVCILLYRLACLDYSPRVAAKSVLYLMAFSMAFFLFAVYTEALFMALAIGAFYAARKNRWLLALMLTALAVLTKNQGLVLAVALLAEYARQIKWKLNKIDVRLLYFGLPILAFVGWIAFNAIAFGDPLEFLTVNKTYWNRYTALPWQTLFDATNILFHPEAVSNKTSFVSNLLNYPFTIGFIILFIAAAWLIYKKKLQLPYFLFFAGCLIQSLLLPIINNPLCSLPRYLMIIFPAFFLMAQLGTRFRLFHLLYLVLSLPILILSLVVFALGFWIA